MRFRSEATELARQAAQAGAIARHYLHLGERQRRNFFADTRAIHQENLLRHGRPLRCAGCDSRGSSGGTVHFPALIAESDLPEVLGIVDDLMVRKAATRGLGVGTLPVAIRT